jgi:DNA-directed RNA polymerase specialized sigma24 family protein
MYNDEFLVFGLITRDSDAIRYAYKKYGPALYGVVRHYANNHIDQIFLKSFTRIINSIESYNQANSRLFTWMYCIVMDEIKKDIG